ncbi:hypothetical protein [Streptomyces sp. NPDC002580]|uniref:hypothetical protein n=1 Tax=Streptomyces sp. NPDC002580 TaxID=3364653 RepID=UPI0036B60E51
MARYEMIHSARDSAEATRISTWLHAFDHLHSDDGVFDMTASLTGQPTERVVPPGTADH